MINWTDFELNAIILKKKEEKEDFASSRSVPFGSDKNISRHGSFLIVDWMDAIIAN